MQDQQRATENVGKEKHGTRSQGCKMREKKLLHKTAGVENVGKVTYVTKLKQHKVKN